MRRVAALSKGRKLAFMAGVGIRKAERAIAGTEELDVAKLDRQLDLPAGTLAGFMGSDRTELPRRLDPNRLTRQQLEQLPGISAAGAQRARKGGPYFSLEELAAVTEVPTAVLGQLVEAPRYARRDKTRNARLSLRPEPGMYVSELAPGFEEQGGGLASAGYAIHRAVAVAVGGRRVAVIAPSDFLAAPRAADEVKAELSGRVIPAVRDAEGLLRLFVPRSVDLWFKRGTPPAVAKARIELLGLQPRREAFESLQALGFYPCELTAWPDGDPFAAMLEVIDRAQDLAEVRFAEPDEIGIGDFAPDRSSPLPRASEFEAAERFWNHDLCGLTAAHAITRGSDKVIVITVDSGIATAHPDLAGELRPGWQQLDLAFATDEDAAESSPGIRPLRRHQGRQHRGRQRQRRRGRPGHRAGLPAAPDQDLR